MGGVRGGPGGGAKSGDAGVVLVCASTVTVAVACAACATAGPMPNAAAISAATAAELRNFIGVPLAG